MESGDPEQNLESGSLDLIQSFRPVKLECEAISVMIKAKFYLIWDTF